MALLADEAVNHFRPTTRASTPAKTRADLPERSSAARPNAGRARAHLAGGSED
jgi:hypothetical protein